MNYSNVDADETLDAVRDSFRKAEGQYAAATKAVESLIASSAALQQAHQGLAAAAESLVKLGVPVRDTAERLDNGLAAMQEGISLLSRFDPGSILRAVKELEVATTQAQGEYVKALGQGVDEVKAGHDVLASRQANAHGEILSSLQGLLASLERASHQIVESRKQTELHLISALEGEVAKLAEEVRQQTQVVTQAAERERSDLSQELENTRASLNKTLEQAREEHTAQRDRLLADLTRKIGGAKWELRAYSVLTLLAIMALMAMRWKRIIP